MGRGRIWATIILVFYLFLIFVCFWPCWVLIASRGLSLVAASTGDTRYCGAWLLIAMASLVAEQGL